MKRGHTFSLAAQGSSFNWN